MHLTPKCFSLNRIYLLFKAFGCNNFWICLNLQFSMFSQNRLEVFQVVWGSGCWWCLLKNQTRWHLNQLVEENRKQNWIFQNIFRLTCPKFCLRIISFSSLKSELSFDSKDSEKNFDWVHLRTEITAWSFKNNLQYFNWWLGRPLYRQAAFILGMES